MRQFMHVVRVEHEISRLGPFFHRSENDSWTSRVELWEMHGTPIESRCNFPHALCAEIRRWLPRRDRQAFLAHGFQFVLYCVAINAIKYDDGAQVQFDVNGVKTKRILQRVI